MRWNLILYASNIFFAHIRRNSMFDGICMMWTTQRTLHYGEAKSQFNECRLLVEGFPRAHITVPWQYATLLRPTLNYACVVVCSDMIGWTKRKTLYNAAHTHTHRHKTFSSSTQLIKLIIKRFSHDLFCSVQFARCRCLCRRQPPSILAEENNKLHSSRLRLSLLRFILSPCLPLCALSPPSMRLTLAFAITTHIVHRNAWVESLLVL